MAEVIPIDTSEQDLVAEVRDYGLREWGMLRLASQTFIEEPDILSSSRVTDIHGQNAALLAHRALARFCPVDVDADIIFGEGLVNLLATEAYTTRKMCDLLGFPFPKSGRVCLVGSGSTTPEVLALSRQIEIAHPLYFQSQLKQVVEELEPRPELLFTSEFTTFAKIISTIAGISERINPDFDILAFDPRASVDDLKVLNRYQVRQPKVTLLQKDLQWFLDSRHVGFDEIFWNRVDPEILFSCETFGENAALYAQAFGSQLAYTQIAEQSMQRLFPEELKTMKALVKNLARRLKIGGSAHITVGQGHTLYTEVERHMRDTFLSLLTLAAKEAGIFDRVTLFPLTHFDKQRLLTPQASFTCAYLKKH